MKIIGLKEVQEQFNPHSIPFSILDIGVRICVNYCICEAEHNMAWHGIKTRASATAKRRREMEKSPYDTLQKKIVRVSGGLKNDCMLELCILFGLTFSILLFPVHILHILCFIIFSSSRCVITNFAIDIEIYWILIITTRERAEIRAQREGKNWKLNSTARTSWVVQISQKSHKRSSGKYCAYKRVVSLKDKTK